VLGRRRGADPEGEQDVSQDPSDVENPSTQAVIDRLEEHQAWVAARFEELATRLDRIETQIAEAGAQEGGDGDGGIRRQKGKKGMSRQEVLAIRATKKRARRAAELKAKHDSPSDGGEAPAAS